jgi:hypothetical protein
VTLRPNRLPGYAAVAASLLALCACASGGSRGGAPEVSSSTPGTSSSPTRPDLTKVTADCNHFTVRPRRIGIACGDGGFYLDDLHYERWTRVTALATGIAATRRCVPDCARGHYVRQRVRVTFDRVRVVFGSPIFTRVEIRYAVSGRLERDYVLPLGCSVTPPHCPRKRP